MKIINAIAGLGLLAMANSASASVMMAFTDVTEGTRDLVAGTMAVDTVDVPTKTPFNLGTLYSAGDMISLYGRIVGAVDPYTITSNTAFTVSFIFGGLELDNGGSLAESGFVLEGNNGSNTSDFSLSDGVSYSEMTTFVTDVVGGTALIFSAPAGTYDFIVDGTGKAALYDVKFTAVPVPAALPLLLGGIGMLGMFGRKKKAELV